MSLQVKDGAAADKYVLTEGAGSAGENFTLQHGQPGTILAVTLTLDTAPYATGDVLSATAAISNAVRVADGRAVLENLVLIDQDDNKQGIDIYFLDANVSMGTFNVAPAISDANALNILGCVEVVAADYNDLGGVSVANIRNINMHWIPATGTRTVYIATVLTSGTPTYTAAGIKLRLGVRWQ